MTDHTADLLSAIAAAKKRDDVVPAYAAAIVADLIPPALDWRAVNIAIIGRWSHSGLDYIKKGAWRIKRRSQPALKARESTNA